MAQADGISRTHNDASIAELFFADGGFAFSNDKKAYRKFSQKLSDLLARPVVVVNLQDLPHAYKNPFAIPGGDAFTAEQITERAAALRTLCAASLPGVAPEKWRIDFEGAAANAGAVASSWIDNDKPNGNRFSRLTPRMAGECWHQMAVILVPDRRWTDKAMWSMRTGLDEAAMSHYPKGEGAKYLSFFHELSHILQNGLSPTAAPPVVRWANETDADKGAVTYGAILARDPRAPKELALSLMEASMAEAPVRAMERFLKAPAHYATALSIDTFLRGGVEPAYEKTRAVDCELRCRAYANRRRQKGQEAHLAPTSDSEAVQNMVNAYWAGTLKTPGLKDVIGTACDNLTSQENRIADLRALREVLTERAITDPLTRRTGQLIMDAARLFCPQIFEQPTLNGQAQEELTISAPREKRHETPPHLPAVRQPSLAPLALHA